MRSWGHYLRASMWGNGHSHIIGRVSSDAAAPENNLVIPFKAKITTCDG